MKHKTKRAESGPPPRNNCELATDHKVNVNESAPSMAASELEILDTPNNEAAAIKDLNTKKRILKELKKKSIQHIAEIQKKRHEREVASEKDRKRQLRQKLILRNQYLKNEKKDEYQENHSSSEDDSEERPNEESKKVLSLEETKLLALRLSRRKHEGLFVAQSEVLMDFAKWKRKNNVQSNQKVFCLSGWYPSVKDNLTERGWFYNPDFDSIFFDLKWSLSSNEIQYDKLQTTQRVNHYQNSGPLTTKAG